MKKLANVSPFILLLVPVVFMFIVTLTTSAIHNPAEEVALKQATPTATGALVKVIPAILK
ncbi:hypothetical protein D9M68_637000 [compost metagenome]